MNIAPLEAVEELQLTPLPHPFSRYCIDLKDLVVYHTERKTQVAPFYREGSKRTFYNLYLDYASPTGQAARKSVQRGELVLRATQGAPKFEKYEVSHLDNDCANDRPDNLAWESKVGNIGRYVAQANYKGYMNPNAKLAFPDRVHQLRAEGKTAKEIARLFSVHPSTIYRELKKLPPGPTQADDASQDSWNPLSDSFNPFTEEIP